MKDVGFSPERMPRELLLHVVEEPSVLAGGQVLQLLLRAPQVHEPPPSAQVALDVVLQPRVRLARASDSVDEIEQAIIRKSFRYVPVFCHVPPLTWNARPLSKKPLPSWMSKRQGLSQRALTEKTITEGAVLRMRPCPFHRVPHRRRR